MKGRHKRPPIIFVAEAILFLLLIVLSAYNIFNIIKSLCQPNTTPDFFGYKSYAIISGSMEPTYHVNDIIFVKEILAEDLREQDVISFREGHSVVTHRIVEVIEDENGRSFITKGDNNNTSDGFYVYEDEVLGVITGVVKYVGYPTIWFTETFKGV